jgi:2-haloacid dehalogenase
VLPAFDDLLTVEGRTPWKPARAAYVDAVARTGTTGPAYLVAVHPWDVHGAAEAGLSTAWVNRAGIPYPAHFTPPTVTVASIGELVRHLDAAP